MEETWNPAEEPSEELARLAQETIESRVDAVEPEVVRQRCQRVITLYSAGFVQSDTDNFHAALVLLYGEKAAHYELARMFARRAADKGEMRAWSLQAMAMDRLLLAQGRAQRFGTQIIKQHGRWTLGDIDPRTTDSERALYGVPPLFVQQQRVEQLQREEERDL